jgi:hypothetical protein
MKTGPGQKEMLTSKLYPQRATETPAAIVGLRTVVINEDTAEPAITKDSAAELSDVSRRF